MDCIFYILHSCTEIFALIGSCNAVLFSINGHRWTAVKKIEGNQLAFFMSRAQGGLESDTNNNAGSTRYLSAGENIIANVKNGATGKGSVSYEAS